METVVKRQPPRVVVVIVNFVCLTFLLIVQVSCAILFTLVMGMISFKTPTLPTATSIVHEGLYQLFVWSCFFIGFMLNVGIAATCLKDLTPGIVSAVERRARAVRSWAVQLSARIDAIDIPAMIRERRARR